MNSHSYLLCSSLLPVVFTTNFSERKYWPYSIHSHILPSQPPMVIVKNSSPPLTGSQLLSNSCLTVGNLLVICQLTVCWLSADSLPTVGRLLADNFIQVLLKRQLLVGNLLANSWLSVSWLSLICWQGVGYLLVECPQLKDDYCHKKFIIGNPW